MAEGNRERKQINVVLLGLGVVGSGVARTLSEKAAVYAQRVGCPVVLRRVLVRDVGKERPNTVPHELLTDDPRQALEQPDIDIVIEVMGGERPAYDYLKESLARGRYVVTANKEVMAKHGAELVALAQQHGVDILYEASVGAGIPLIAPLKRDLLANEITSIRAIINGTTNYILTRMSREGIDFGEALSQAQALGYAEADPRNDVEGIDAAYKLAILSTLAFHTRVLPQDIYTEGISRLTARDFRYARELGYAVKLLAIAQRNRDRVRVRVHPTLIWQDEPLAKVDGVLNAIQVAGDLLGPVLFEGQGAGSLPTTSGVVADVLDAARTIVHGGHRVLRYAEAVQADIEPIEELISRYYIRMSVADRPGVLAQIAKTLGDREISIASVLQKETDAASQTAEIVIMTHPSREKAVQQAIAEMEQLAVVNEVGNFIRVED